MSEHTTEPWESPWENEYHTDSIISTKTGEEVVGVTYYDGPHLSITEANARRIVACVNACTGISTEELERVASTKAPNPLAAAITLGYREQQAVKQRDEAAQMAINFIKMNEPTFGEWTDRQLSDMHEYIVSKG